MKAILAGFPVAVVVATLALTGSQTRRSLPVLKIDAGQRENGSFSGRTEEERFLDHAVRARPRRPIEIDLGNPRSEARRVLGELRDLFQEMQDLAAAFKDSDRARYVSEMESLKDRLVGLLDAAKKIVCEEDGAKELIELVSTETDSVLRKRFALLFRYTHRETLGPFLGNLVNSRSAVDRAIAIEGLRECRTVEAVHALSFRADTDPEMDLRQRAIIGLGVTLRKPSRGDEEYEEIALTVIRKYAQSDNLPALRAAAFEALRSPVFLAKEDRDLITTAYSTDPRSDPAVFEAIQRAYCDMAHRRNRSTGSAKK